MEVEFSGNALARMAERGIAEAEVRAVLDGPDHLAPFLDRFWHARKVVAGRKLAWPVLVFTLLSSWIGAGSLFAGGENAYRNGFAALWQPAGGWLGLIVIAALSGLTVIAIFMAGWSSNNKYAVLGGMRSVAQVIAYEIPVLLSALVVKASFYLTLRLLPGRVMDKILQG